MNTLPTEEILPDLFLLFMERNPDVHKFVKSQWSAPQIQLFLVRTNQKDLKSTNIYALLFMLVRFSDRTADEWDWVETKLVAFLEDWSSL